MSNQPTITVLTPTFNRAHLLGRVFKSLQNQQYTNLEWLVIDDGSSDDTLRRIEHFKTQAQFPIRYFRQSNAGKHQAINRGVERAKGEYTLILDSDDWLTDNALLRMVEVWQRIPESVRDQYSSVVGLCALEDRSILGTAFPEHDMDANPISLRHTHRVSGDKISLLATHVLRQYPFPEGTKGLVPEALIWNRMAETHRERCVNEIWMFKECRPDSLQTNALERQIQAAPLTQLFHLELANTGQALPLSVRAKAYANAARFGLHDHHGPLTGTLKAKHKPLAVGMTLLGLALYARDKLSRGKSQHHEAWVAKTIKQAMPQHNTPVVKMIAATSGPRLPTSNPSSHPSQGREQTAAKAARVPGVATARLVLGR